MTVPAGTLPTGTVTFFDGDPTAGAPCSAQPQPCRGDYGGTISFTATMPTTFSAAGSHTIFAVYEWRFQLHDQHVFGKSIFVVFSTNTVVTSDKTKPGTAMSQLRSPRRSPVT